MTQQFQFNGPRLNAADKPPVHSLLFNPASNLGWYAGCGDGTSVEIQEKMIDQLDLFGANAMAVCLMNEDLSTVFKGSGAGHRYMGEPDERRMKLYLDFARRLKARGKYFVPVFFDGDERSFSRSDSKYPFHKQMEKHAPFMEAATRYLAPYADAIAIGVESNRYARIELVEDAIAWVRQFAHRTLLDGSEWNIPVGTHEQNVGRRNGRWTMLRRVPRGASFHGYELSSHPRQGHTRSPDDMREEVQFLADNCPVPIWIMEASDKKDDLARRQNHEMAKVAKVVGIDGVW